MPKIERRHTWVYTCMNPDFFHLTLRYLPDRPWPAIRHMIVVTSEHRPELVADLQAIAARMRPRWPITVVTDGVLRVMSASYPPALRRYTEVSLGVKIMIPLWVPAPFFFTDDDVIVINDPSEVLAEGTMWGSHSGLDQYTESGPDQDELSTWQRVINDKSMTRDVFNQNRTDAAVWHFPEFDRNEYHDVLYRFFATDAAQDAAMKGGNRFRLMDQRFLTTWLHSTAGDTVTAPIYRAWPYKKLPAKVPADGNFIHYCASSQKYRYVEWLNRVADERGLTT